MVDSKRFYQREEAMPPDERKIYTDSKIRWIIEYAHKNSPGIRAIMDEAGISPSDIKSSDDIEKFPIISKEKLIDLQRKKPPFGGFLAVPINQGGENIHIARPFI